MVNPIRDVQRMQVDAQSVWLLIAKWPVATAEILGKITEVKSNTQRA